MEEDCLNIYFDNNSTTPMCCVGIDEFQHIVKKYFGNPSSITLHGRSAKGLLISAREIVSDFLHCLASEVVFTSGGTESIHTIIRGISENRTGTILTTKAEHNAVLEAVLSTKKEVEYLPLDAYGQLDIKELKDKISTNIAAVVLSLVNGETGALLPLKEIAAITNTHSVPLIIDGVAALGKMPIVIYPGVTAMAFSGHKCHGPKGCGFFYLKNKTNFSPLLTGGGQESGYRSGTENIPAIGALAKVLSTIKEENYIYLETLRSHFENKVKKIFPDSEINCNNSRVSNVSNIFFNEIDGDHLLIFLDQHGVSASLGSACSSGTLKPSHVLLAMGYSTKRARSSIRFSFSKFNTIEEINKVCDILKKYKEKYTFQDILCQKQ